MNPMCCNPIRILVYMWITFLLNKTSAHEQCPVAELRTRESHWSFCANNSHFCLYDISKRKADIHVRRGVRRGFFLQIFSKHSVRLKHMHVCMKKKVCKYIHHGTAHMCKVFFNTIEKKSDLSVWMLNFFLLIELFQVYTTHFDLIKISLRFIWVHVNVATMTGVWHRLLSSGFKIKLSIFTHAPTNTNIR